MEASLKNKFIMLCGLPGSGKTTVAMELAKKPNTIWISSDRIRKENYGSESNLGVAHEVFAIMAERTYDALKAGQNVIYDATNISSKRRISFLNTLKKFDCYKECIIIATPYSECISRDKSRKRVVQESVISKMYKSWNTPHKYEGWDEVNIHYSANARKSLGSVMDCVESLMEAPHDTPYHTETIGEHMKAVGDYIKTKGFAEASNLCIAGYLHDCGKPYTKGFRDAKGNPCEVAHYYQHQSTGAYDALFYDFGDKTDDDILEISTLISLHMNPFTWQKESTKEKNRKLLGEDLYEKVLLLNEADEASSNKAPDLINASITE